MTTASQNTVPAGRAPLVVGVILLGIASVTLLDALNVASGMGPNVGPSAAMKLIALILAFLGVAHIVQAVRLGKQRQVREAEDKINPVSLAWVFAGLVLQIVALSLNSGFIVSSTILFAFTACGFGRSLKSLGPVYGLVLSTLVYLFFTKALSLSLPAGPLERLLG
jgi:putative tricarboxylic transport membrane protein